MDTQVKEAVICGAGIAGVSVAYHLAAMHGMTDVVLVDERPPLSLTSDKSTECYRNWWPGPGDEMVALMNRSIDLLERLAEESGNYFLLNRRGYLYLTASPANLERLVAEAREPARLGAGELRVHTSLADEADYQPVAPEGFHGQPDGADLILEPQLLRKRYPYLNPQVIAGLHVRRAGWLSAQQLGMVLLEKARAHGVRLVEGRVSAVIQEAGKVKAVKLADGRSFATPHFVNAAGPFIDNICNLLGIDLPVYSELHLKAAIRDRAGAVPRHAPLLIWKDAQKLAWTSEEAAELSADSSLRWLLGEMPAGVHTRPEGGADSQVVLMLWEIHNPPVEPVFPPPFDPMYPDVALRGLATMIPALKAYLQAGLRPVLDGGYYTKTKENRPLIGPLPVEGAFLCGALSGFGVMAACAAGELAAAHVTGSRLPAYASAFMLERYQDTAYLERLRYWGSSGQL